MEDPPGEGRSLSTSLFIYGTLLPGESNHPLLAAARPLGPAWTPPEYELLDLDGFPALVAGGRSRVAGELFAVDARTLAAVDELEDHPRYYRRTWIALERGRRAFAYLLPRSLAAGWPRIPGGDWRAHTRRCGT